MKEGIWKKVINWFLIVSKTIIIQEWQWRKAAAAAMMHFYCFLSCLLLLHSTCKSAILNSEFRISRIWLFPLILSGKKASRSKIFMGGFQSVKKPLFYFKGIIITSFWSFLVIYPSIFKITTFQRLNESLDFCPCSSLTNCKWELIATFLSG